MYVQGPHQVHKGVHEVPFAPGQAVPPHQWGAGASQEVKESLAKQVVEKEAELGELRSQFDNSQITLNSAQKEIEGHRKRAQQEELQIAEVKMMMHQV